MPELARLELAFLNLLRQLDSANSNRRVVESFEAWHRPNSLFHTPMAKFQALRWLSDGAPSTNSRSQRTGWRSRSRRFSEDCCGRIPVVDFPYRRISEQPAVLPTELRGAFITDAVAYGSDVFSFISQELIPTRRARSSMRNASRKCFFSHTIAMPMR